MLRVIVYVINGGYDVLVVYPKGIILNKHNIDNHAVTHYFNFIFKGYQYRYHKDIVKNL